jgi:hypothetical protein
MIKHAHDQNYDNVLFLEEDACFTNISPKTIQNVEKWLLNNKSKWDSTVDCFYRFLLSKKDFLNFLI